MFSTVKRAWTSISPSELDAWGDQYSPDSILLKGECLVKSCYSFFFPTSLLTPISSPLGVSRSRDKWTMIHMQSMHNRVYFACLASPAEVTLHRHTSHPTTLSCTHIHALLWRSYDFFISMVWNQQHDRSERGIEERCLHISDKWACCFR